MIGFAVQRMNAIHSSFLITFRPAQHAGFHFNQFKPFQALPDLRSFREHRLPSLPGHAESAVRNFLETPYRQALDAASARVDDKPYLARQVLAYVSTRAVIKKLTSAHGRIPVREKHPGPVLQATISTVRSAPDVLLITERFKNNAADFVGLDVASSQHRRSGNSLAGFSVTPEPLLVPASRIAAKVMSLFCHGPISPCLPIG